MIQTGPEVDSRLNVGIIGFGKMGILHAGILNALEQSKVVAITESEGLLRRYAGKLLSGLAFYSNVGEMLANEDLDAVYVTTPITTHLGVMEDIVESGADVAVFVEKPLANTSHDAERMFDMAKSHGLKTMVGFQKRFSPVFRRARQVLLSGDLGEATSVSAHSYVSGIFSGGKGWRFKQGQGGALLDLGPHLLDLLLWYFGEPIAVEGTLRSVHSAEVDDAAQGTLSFGAALTGTFEISWSRKGYRLPEIGIEVTCRNGKLYVTDDYLSLEFYSDAPGMRAGKHCFQKPEFDSGVDFLIGDSEYCAEDKHFVECLLKEDDPKPDFSDGFKVNKVIEQVRHPPEDSRMVEN